MKRILVAYAPQDARDWAAIRVWAEELAVALASALG
jgi:hypothetical protein